MAQVAKFDYFHVNPRQSEPKTTTTAISKMLSIKEVVKEAALNTTFQGVSNIARSRQTALKLLWTACILVSCSTCIYLNINSVLNFLEYNVVTQIRTIKQTKAEFVTISMCNLNSLVSSTAAQFAEKQISSSNESIAVPDAVKSGYVFTNPLLFQYIATSIGNDPSILDEQKRQFTIPFDDMIVGCSFNFEACNRTHFRWYYDPLYGNCYKFNSGTSDSGASVKLLESEMNGQIYGLQLQLVVPEPMYNFSFPFSLGAHIQVHNRTTMPSFHKGFHVPVGTFANLAISRSMTKRLPRPYSDCLTLDDIKSFHSFLTDFFVKNKLEYSQEGCFKYCYQRRVHQTCRCYDASYSLMTFNATPCLGAEQTYCRNEAFKWSNTQEAFLNCSHDCPLECESMSYGVSLSFSDFPAPVYAKWLERMSPYLRKLVGNISGDAERYSVIKRNVLSLNVYYEDLSYTFVEEAPKKQLVELVSDLGGTLGLFVGISFLSFVELFELMLHVLVIVLMPSFNNKEMN